MHRLDIVFESSESVIDCRLFVDSESCLVDLGGDPRKSCLLAHTYVMGMSVITTGFYLKRQALLKRVVLSF